jgi:signal transduction histidine kinase
MTQQIGELLDTTQLQMGKALALDLQPVNLAELLEDLVREYAQASQGHTVHLQNDWQDPPICMCDRPRLRRALANVFMNAIKYSPDGGDVAVMLARSMTLANTAIATIRIVDHGLGIPAAELPRVFERYYRAGNVGHISGTGIGLAGVKQVVEQHGGSIVVDSVEGTGTTVTIQLPLVAPQGLDEALDRSS